MDVFFFQTEPLDFVVFQPTMAGTIGGKESPGSYRICMASWSRAFVV